MRVIRLKKKTRRLTEIQPGMMFCVECRGLVLRTQDVKIPTGTIAGVFVETGECYFSAERSSNYDFEIIDGSFIEER